MGKHGGLEQEAYPVVNWEPTEEFWPELCFRKTWSVLV